MAGCGVLGVVTTFVVPSLGPSAETLAADYDDVNRPWCYQPWSDRPLPFTVPAMEAAELPRLFGKTVRELRLARGISQEQLAADAGIDRAYMGGIERGQRNPSLTMLARVARGLDLSMTDVFKAVESRQRKKR